MQPLDEFLYNWGCVELSITAEIEAQKEAEKEAKSGGNKGPQMNFDDWEKAVSLENAASAKERIGVKYQRKG